MQKEQESKAVSNMKVELRDSGVLIVRHQGKLRTEDFEKLAGIVDPWIEKNHQLRGVVICIQKFPGWKISEALFTTLNL